MKSQAENYKHLKEISIEKMSEYNVFRINQVNSFKKNAVGNAELGFGNSACDLTVSFPSSLSIGKHR